MAAHMHSLKESGSLVYHTFEHKTGCTSFINITFLRDFCGYFSSKHLKE